MSTEHSAVTEPTASFPTQDADGSRIVYVREARHRGRGLLIFIGVIGLLVAGFFGLKSLDLLPNLNPFTTQTTDRSGPVLLTSMKDLSRYEAAEGSFQVLVDLQENNKYIPDFIFNNRTLFVGIGTVDAYVDFSKLTDGSIKVSADGKSVEITLPEPVLDKPQIDTQKSYVFAEEKGAFNRVTDIFSGDPNKQAQLYSLAQQKIGDAATDSELVARAEKNTRSMLVSLLTQLGFDRITVNFSSANTP